MATQLILEWYTYSVDAEVVKQWLDESSFDQSLLLCALSTRQVRQCKASRLHQVQILSASKQKKTGQITSKPATIHIILSKLAGKKVPLSPRA